MLVEQTMARDKPLATPRLDADATPRGTRPQRLRVAPELGPALEAGEILGDLLAEFWSNTAY